MTPELPEDGREKPIERPLHQSLALLMPLPSTTDTRVHLPMVGAAGVWQHCAAPSGLSLSKKHTSLNGLESVGSTRCRQLQSRQSSLCSN